MSVIELGLGTITTYSSNTITRYITMIGKRIESRTGASLVAILEVRWLESMFASHYLISARISSWRKPTRHEPSMGVVMGSKKRRFSFRCRRVSCNPSGETVDSLKALYWTSFARFSGVGNEYTRLQESKVRAQDLIESVDAIMKGARRL